MFSSVILVIFCLSESQAATGPVFKSNAVDHMNIEHKKSWRRGENVYDFTKLEVGAKLLDMLEDPSVIDKQRVTVEFKSAVTEWEEHEAKPSLRGGWYRWTIPERVPCHDHKVRITVYGEDGSKNTFYYPHTIVAPNMEDIIVSGYRPQMPEFIKAGDYEDGRLEVRWQPSHCAGTYEVLYSPIGGEARTVQAVESEIVLENLESCQEYEVSVNAILGEEYSDEAKLTFMTNPDPEVADRLQPVLEAGTDSVQVKWRASERLSCIPSYRVSLCSTNGGCQQTRSLETDNSLQWMEYSSVEPLAMCTGYSINIQPVHPSSSVAPHIVQFRTRSQPLEDIDAAMTPITASIDPQRMVTVSWSPVPCSQHYNVYQRSVDNMEWLLLGTTMEASYSLKAESCSEYVFAITAVVDDTESEKVMAPEPIVTEVSTEELPLMVVEEKANGSITFVIKSSEVNTMCEVDRLHIKHAGGEQYFEMNEVQDNRITINILEEADLVEGRLHYRQTDSWSPWGSSDSPIMEKQTLQEMNFLLPIIIGSVVALVLIITVIFLVVKSKKDKTKYDEEKANGATDESRKLNDSSEEKIINGKK